MTLRLLMYGRACTSAECPESSVAPGQPHRLFRPRGGDLAPDPACGGLHWSPATPAISTICAQTLSARSAVLRSEETARRVSDLREMRAELPHQHLYMPAQQKSTPLALEHRKGRPRTGLNECRHTRARPYGARVSQTVFSRGDKPGVLATSETATSRSGARSPPRVGIVDAGCPGARRLSGAFRACAARPYMSKRSDHNGMDP